MYIDVKFKQTPVIENNQLPKKSRKKQQLT